MSMYREGYDYYVNKCLEFDIEPINFYYYISHLTKEQLDHFNKQALILKG
ncbi:hypothetical protein MTP04_17430 [Lysinibacillus sp. PLM2]|nr:hypothetical protein MTP04_17430 [Lysinibacillus sp. PLM2]